MGEPEASTAAHARHSAIYTLAQIIGEDGDGGDVDSHIATDNSPRESFTGTSSSWTSFPYSSASTANSGLEAMPTPPRSAGPQYQPQPQEQQQYRQVQARLQQQHHHHHHHHHHQQSDQSQNQEQDRDPQQQEQRLGLQQRHHHEHRPQQQSDYRQQQHHNPQHQQQRHRSQQQQQQQQQEHPQIHPQQRHDTQQQWQQQRPQPPQHQGGQDQNGQPHQYPTPLQSQHPQPFFFSEARARQLEADLDRLGARVAEVEIVNIALVQRLAFLEEGIVRVVREMGDQFCRVERRTDQLVLLAIIDGYEAVLGIYPPSESPISASASLGTRLRAVRDRLAPYSPNGSLAFSDDDPRSMLAVIPNYEDAMEHWLAIHGTRNVPSPAGYCDGA